MFFLDTSQVASADTSVDVSAFNQLAEAIGGDQIQTRRRRFNVFLGLKCPRRSSFSCSTSAPPSRAPPSPPPPSPARQVLFPDLLFQSIRCCAHSEQAKVIQEQHCNNILFEAGTRINFKNGIRDAYILKGGFRGCRTPQII